MKFQEKSKFKGLSLGDWKKKFQPSKDNPFKIEDKFKKEKIGLGMSFPSNNSIEVQPKNKTNNSNTSNTIKKRTFTIPKSSKFVQQQNIINKKH